MIFDLAEGGAMTSNLYGDTVYWLDGITTVYAVELFLVAGN